MVNLKEMEKFIYGEEIKFPKNKRFNNPTFVLKDL